ncbi:MAG TPA: potassium transporter Kup, partial [Puia sp.]
LLNIGRADDPYTMEYSVEPLLENKIMRIDFRLGFRIQPKIGIMFRKVVEELIANNEIVPDNRFPGLSAEGPNDFRFVILERFLSYDNEFRFREGFILNTYFSIIKLAQSDPEAYGIDSDQAVVEKVPLVVAPVTKMNLRRIKYGDDG